MSTPSKEPPMSTMKVEFIRAAARCIASAVPLTKAEDAFGWKDSEVAKHAIARARALAEALEGEGLLEETPPAASAAPSPVASSDPTGVPVEPLATPDAAPTRKTRRP